MVHGQHRIEVAKRTGTEESVGTVGAEARESLAIEALHEGCEQFHLFAPVESFVAVVGVEAEHGNAGGGDAKVAFQRGMEAAQLCLYAFGGDLRSHFAQRKVGGDERHAHEGVEQDHERLTAAGGLEKFGVTGILEVGRLDAGLVDGTGDDGVDVAGIGRRGGRLQRTERHATGFGRGAAGLDLHVLVADHVDQVEAVGMRLFGLLDAVPVHVEVEGFAVVGGDLLAAVDDGGAKFQEFGLSEGFEDEFIADAVGVAVGDGDAYLSVHCDSSGGGGKNEGRGWAQCARALGAFLFHAFGGEHTAGGVDVLSARGAHGCGDAVGIEIVLQAEHGRFVRAVETRVGDGVETDHVDATVEGSEQTHEGAAVFERVVDAAKHDVFERQAALFRAFGVVVGRFAAEIILTQQLDERFDAESAFGRHHRAAFGRVGVVERDGQAAFALVEKAAQALGHAHRGHGYALRTPGVAPRCGEGFGGTEHIVDVVHRFALTHEDDVGEALTFGQRIDLVQDVGRGELCHEALSTGHAELARHFAPHLRRNAEGGALAVGDEHRLDVVPLGGAKEIFDRAVARFDAFHRGGNAQHVGFGQACAGGFREVGHLVERAGVLVVNPTTKLFSHEARQTELDRHGGKFVEGETEESRFGGKGSGVVVGHRGVMR